MTKPFTETNNQDFAIVLNNVTFGYNENRPIVKNVSIAVPYGRIVAIMGGSGCGKTTILRLISGQHKRQQGQIHVLGQEINCLNECELFKLRKKIGVLFQFGALFTDMSVYENVAFPLKEHTNLPESIIRIIVAMKLKAVGLFGTQEMLPQDLSGGMAKRVALARSMALDPALMMYDEPFTGLDPIALNITAMLIKTLSKSLEQTVVLVTHDIATTFKIADYIFFMENGRIIAHGSVEEMVNTGIPIVKQFITGNISGEFRYEYACDIDYANFLGIKTSA